MKVLVVGAGVAGLAAARRLQDAGCAVQLLDKGRGPGGRLATRRNEFGAFDHGTAAFSADDPMLQDWLAAGQAAGVLAPTAQGWTGVPRMSALPRYLAEGLALRSSVEAVRVGMDAVVEDRCGDYRQADAVILAVPAPQALALLGEDAEALRARLAAVSYTPCWSLMAVIERGPDEASTPEAPLAVLRREADRPGRDDHGCWVAQASVAWSAENLALSAESAADALRAALCTQLDIDRGQLRFLQAHRWRFARVKEAVGVDYLSSEGGRLWLAGDGILGDGVSAALRSGMAAADALLARTQGDSAIPK